jgi:nitrite reductase/ring-hydroxylating ferredoxin subunit
MSAPSQFLSRREFCAGACQVASCATLATLASACSGDGSPTSPGGGGGGGTSMLPVLNGQFANSRVQVSTTSALANVDSAALVESIAGVFLVARTSATTFTVIDATCTHEGCTVNGVNGSIYVCPCHGSRYNRNGQVVNGPAKASLRQYSASFANDILTITV